LKFFERIIEMTTKDYHKELRRLWKISDKAELLQSLTGAEMTTQKYVINQYGKEIDFDAAVNIMDDDLREQLNNELAPCTNQKFFEAYAKAHLEKFDEEFEPNKANPVW